MAATRLDIINMIEVGKPSKDKGGAFEAEHRRFDGLHQQQARSGSNAEYFDYAEDLLESWKHESDI